MAVEREISVRDRERDLEERVIQLVLDRERSMMISGVHVGRSPLISGLMYTHLQGMVKFVGLLLRELTHAARAFL